MKIYKVTLPNDDLVKGTVHYLHGTCHDPVRQALGNAFLRADVYELIASGYFKPIYSSLKEKEDDQYLAVGRFVNHYYDLCKLEVCDIDRQLWHKVMKVRAELHLPPITTYFTFNWESITQDDLDKADDLLAL